MRPYPSTDLEREAALMSLLGSFWGATYQGDHVVRSVTTGKGGIEQQVFRQYEELLAAISWSKVPVTQSRTWQPLTLIESERNAGGYAMLKFGDTGVFEAATSTVFGVPQQTDLYAWAVDSAITDIEIITNRITGSSVTLIRDIDFVLVPGYVVFRNNPFANELNTPSTVFESNTAVDRSLDLWAFGCKLELQTPYKLFGYVLELPGTGENYKQTVTALLDSLVDGSTNETIKRAWSAITGVPLVLENGKVETVITDNGRKLVITDKHVYAFDANDVITVVAGDTLAAGATMSEALAFYEFNRGQELTVEQLRALALGGGYLAGAYFADLVFENKDVPLSVSIDALGYTRVSWDMLGWPGDVEAFFDELHARGLSSGQTLANLLDTRPAASQETQPTGDSLPATINPLHFLCQNVLRNNAFVVKVRTSVCAGGVGLSAAKLLRRVVPPQTAMFVVVELDGAEAPIRMDSAGTSEEPGCVERRAIYLGMEKSETLDTSWVSESCKLRQTGGHCV